MADNSVIFHGISITPEYNENQDPIFCGIAINYLESEYEELIQYPNSGPLSLSPKFYGASLKGYINPNNISTSPQAAPSKKVYLTNKGNIMINPNDTILIEL